MKAQIIFFPILWHPPKETLDKLAWYQEQYVLYHAELAYKSKHLSPGENYLFRERSHNAVRETWRLFTGLKEEALHDEDDVINN
jgi:hypothetical protein